MVPLSVLYRIFNVYFCKMKTVIARLEAVWRSPIFGDFSQTLFERQAHDAVDHSGWDGFRYLAGSRCKLMIG
jgi:hypothetical protein